MNVDTRLPSASPTPRIRMLLAEDDEINQEVIRALVAMRGDIDLTVVDDGRAALEKAMAQRYDIMIFDRQMPHLTGDRVIRYLRAAQTPNLSTPMILFTASADHAVIGNGQDMLADMLLPKPIRAEDFFAAIDRLVVIG